MPPSGPRTCLLICGSSGVVPTMMHRPNPTVTAGIMVEGKKDSGRRCSKMIVGDLFADHRHLYPPPSILTPQMSSANNPASGCKAITRQKASRWRTGLVGCQMLKSSTSRVPQLSILTLTIQIIKYI